MNASIIREVQRYRYSSGLPPACLHTRRSFYPSCDNIAIYCCPRMNLPSLIVFDLDACLWTPEMFELSSPPTAFDASACGVRAGHETVRLFPGAQAVVRRLLTQSEYSNVRVAVASSTTEPAYANKCLDLLHELVFGRALLGTTSRYVGNTHRQADAAPSRPTERPPAHRCVMVCLNRDDAPRAGRSAPLGPCLSPSHPCIPIAD